MRARGSTTIFIIAALALHCGVAHAQSAPSEEEILCIDAPDAFRPIPIPPPASDWVKVLCTPLGQAYAPNMKDRVTIWLEHGTRKPFMLYAENPGDPRVQAQIEEEGKYAVRFTSVSLNRLDGADLYEVQQYFLEVFKKAESTQFDAVYRLKAHSSTPGLMYELNFFLMDELPVYLLLCLKDCELMAPMDIYSDGISPPLD